MAVLIYPECSVCFVTVPRGVRFCPQCGSPLTPSAAEEVRKPEPTAPSLSLAERSELERRFREQFERRGLTVTAEQLKQARSVLLGAERQLRRASILFLDLSRYSHIGRILGPDKTEQLIHEYYALCAKVVHQHRGFIVKFTGDGIVAVFGAPLAYDRDAESCVGAALEIRERIAQLETGTDFALNVHAGIATGEVLSGVSERPRGPDYDVIGHAVNLASRLQSRAKADQVLICPATALAVHSAFECEPSRPMRFKNIPGLHTPCFVLGKKQAGGVRRPIRTVRYGWFFSTSAILVSPKSGILIVPNFSSHTVEEKAGVVLY